ncbi:MAG: fibronectin type III domain-containing protein, partial [Armatimonadota bacterium]
MQIVRDRAGTGTAPIRACVLTAAAVAALVMAAAAGPAGAALDAPQNLQAAVMSQTAVQLTWTSSNPSGLEDSYVVERSRYATTAFTAVAEIPATTTSYQDTGLASGTTYYYRVYARTKKGDTAYSNIASATTPGTPPSAPSSLNATAVSSGQIELTWRDNSSNESGFRIERSFYATSGFTQIAVVGANVKSYSNTGLPSSTTYYYRVRAYNSYGASAYSNTAGATTQSTLSLPAAPSDLRATAVSSTQINLTWQDNSTNESGFRIERSHYATSGFTQIAVVGANVTSYANTGLASSTTYYYRVRAYNAYGNSAYSNTASATTSVVMLTPPDAPSGLSAVGGAGRIDLTWVDNSDNETNFDLWRLPSAGAWVNIEHPGANVRSYSDFDVEPGLTYWYVVRAENGAGVSGWSNVASATATATQPQPPAAPYGLSATAVSSSEITLWWSDNSANEAGFRIERSFYPTSGFVQIATVPANVTAYQNFGLAGNTTYYYRVRAYNAYGNSAYSNTAWATTLIVPPAAPSNLRATAASTNRIDLTWTDNSNYEIGFKVERSPSASSGFVQVATVAANVSVYQDTGLSPSTTYYYRVRAYNAYGNSTYSNT